MMTLYQANWWYKSSSPHLSSHDCLWFVLPYHYYGLNTCCSNHSSLDGKHFMLHTRRGMISWERLSEVSTQKRTFCSALSFLIVFSLEHYGFGHFAAAAIYNMPSLSYLSFLSQLFILCSVDSLCLSLMSIMLHAVVIITYTYK